MSKTFQRRVEDFECLHCGHAVSGDGFTNHCPQCLFSRHVDVFPGDRADPCQGLMEPVAVQKKGEGYRIQHRCQLCGVERWNKSHPEDNFERLLELAEAMGRT